MAEVGVSVANYDKYDGQTKKPSLLLLLVNSKGQLRRGVGALLLKL